MLFRKQGLSYGTPAICKIVAAGTAPRFYVYTHEAMWQYSQYQKGLSKIHSDSKRRMYAEIFARYEHLMNIAKASGQRAFKTEIMTRVLEQEAPSFYYEPGVAPQMYYRYIRKRNKKHI